MSPLLEVCKFSSLLKRAKFYIRHFLTLLANDGTNEKQKSVLFFSFDFFRLNEH